MCNFYTDIWHKEDIEEFGGLLPFDVFYEKYVNWDLIPDDKNFAARLYLFYKSGKRYESV